jgi:hypothetical protein
MARITGLAPRFTAAEAAQGLHDGSGMLRAAVVRGAFPRRCSGAFLPALAPPRKPLFGLANYRKQPERYKMCLCVLEKQ